MESGLGLPSMDTNFHLCGESARPTYVSPRAKRANAKTEAARTANGFPPCRFSHFWADLVPPFDVDAKTAVKNCPACPPWRGGWTHLHLEEADSGNGIPPCLRPEEQAETGRSLPVCPLSAEEARNRNHLPSRMLLLGGLGRSLAHSDLGGLGRTLAHSDLGETPAHSDEGEM